MVSPPGGHYKEEEFESVPHWCHLWDVEAVSRDPGTDPGTDPDDVSRLARVSSPPRGAAEPQITRVAEMDEFFILFAKI